MVEMTIADLRRRWRSVEAGGNVEVLKGRVLPTRRGGRVVEERTAVSSMSVACSRGRSERDDESMKYGALRDVENRLSARGVPSSLSEEEEEAGEDWGVCTWPAGATSASSPTRGGGWLMPTRMGRTRWRRTRSKGEGVDGQRRRWA